jgi:hypothetical protein
MAHISRDWRSLDQLNFQSIDDSDLSKPKLRSTSQPNKSIIMKSILAIITFVPAASAKHGQEAMNFVGVDTSLDLARGSGS